MKVRHRIGVFAAALLAALGATAVAATPALAQGEGCGSFNICVWQSASPFAAQAHYFWISPNSSQCLNFPGWLNDTVRSIKLTWGWSATIYEHGGCGGRSLVTVWEGQFKSCSDPSWLGGSWWGCNDPSWKGSSIWFQHPTN